MNNSRFSQPIPIIKVGTNEKSSSNFSGNTSFFSRFNRKQNKDPNSTKPKSRTNLKGKPITPIDHQNYFSSTQKLTPSRQSWQILSAAVHDLATKCFVSLTNPQLMTEFLHAESKLSDFFRLSKMVFNNARPTRGRNPRRMNRNAPQPRPPNESLNRSSSARRKIRNNESAKNEENNTKNESEKNDQTEDPKEPDLNNNSNSNENIKEIESNNNSGSDLKPTHAVNKLGLQFIEQWDSFLGEFNNVSINGVALLNSLISSRLLFISHFMKNTVSLFFASPQANVPIGSMNRAYAVCLSIARKARKLHRCPSDFPSGVIQLENSLYQFFVRIVPHPMAYTNSIQTARKDLLIQLTELKQMVYGISIFGDLIETIRLQMEDVNAKFNDLFSELNLPYRIVASYDEPDEKPKQDLEDVIEEEECEDDDIEVTEKSAAKCNMESSIIAFDSAQKKQDKETMEHLDKIRSNIAKIEEAIVLGQKMIKKKKK